MYSSGEGEFGFGLSLSKLKYDPNSAAKHKRMTVSFHVLKDNHIDATAKTSTAINPFPKRYHKQYRGVCH